MVEKIPFKYDPNNNFLAPAGLRSASMDFIKEKIAEQAKKKGWSVDPVWLMFSWAKEIFEIVQTFEHAGKCEVWFDEKTRRVLINGLEFLAGTVVEPEHAEIYKNVATMLKGKTTDLETNLAKEFGDSEYFKAQSMRAIAPSVSLDAAVKCVYDNNEVNAKKTYLAGKIEER